MGFRSWTVADKFPIPTHGVLYIGKSMVAYKVFSKMSNFKSTVFQYGGLQRSQIRTNFKSQTLGTWRLGNKAYYV